MKVNCKMHMLVMYGFLYNAYQILMGGFILLSDLTKYSSFKHFFDLSSFPVIFLLEVFGLPEMPLTPRATRADEPERYSERFQESRHPQNVQPAAGEFLDSRSSAPPLHVDRGHRIDRGPRYSSNLDKITSTLLELVARK